MTSVKQLLDHKGHDVWTIHPDSSVLVALEMFADKDIGALVVMENDKVVGMFTERLYARNVFLKGKSSPQTPVRDVMEARVVYVRPENTVADCMALMTDKKIRHMAVMQGGKLAGLVSIGDLVKATIADQKFTIEQLENYIHG